MMHNLYRHYDDKGRLLYVGVSYGAIARLQQHRAQSHWYSDIRNIAIEVFKTREKAFIAERKAIKNEKPIHNKAHSTDYGYRPRRVKKKVKENPAKTMFGPWQPYKGRPCGFVVGKNVPDNFPVPTERIFDAEAERSVERVLKVCWEFDTIHVYGTTFPANAVLDACANGVKVVHH